MLSKDRDHFSERIEGIAGEIRSNINPFGLGEFLTCRGIWIRHVFWPSPASSSSRSTIR